MFGLIFLIWVECIILTSFPYFGWYGQFGFDPIHGKCHLVECDEDSENGKIKPSILINTIGTGIPFVIVIISYSAVFLKLREDDNDDSTSQYKISTIILTFCYFIFILPIYVVEFIPVICNKDLASALIYTWYWLVYVINVFVYVIYLPRCREAILTLLADLFSPVIPILVPATRSRTQTETDFGVQMGRVRQEVCLESESEDNIVQESKRSPSWYNVMTQKFTKTKSTQT